MAEDFNEKIKQQQEKDAEKAKQAAEYAKQQQERDELKAAQKIADAKRLLEIEKEQKELQDFLKQNPNDSKTIEKLAVLNEEKKIIDKRNLPKQTENKFSDRIKDGMARTRGQAIAGHAGKLAVDPHLQPSDVLKSSGAIVGHTAMLIGKPAGSALATAFKAAFSKKMGDANIPMATATNIVKKTMKN